MKNIFLCISFLVSCITRKEMNVGLLGYLAKKEDILKNTVLINVFNINIKQNKKLHLPKDCLSINSKKKKQIELNISKNVPNNKPQKYTLQPFNKTFQVILNYQYLSSSTNLH